MPSQDLNPGCRTQSPAHWPLDYSRLTNYSRLTPSEWNSLITFDLMKKGSKSFVPILIIFFTCFNFVANISIWLPFMERQNCFKYRGRWDRIWRTRDEITHLLGDTLLKDLSRHEDPWWTNCAFHRCKPIGWLLVLFDRWPAIPFHIIGRR